MLSIFILIILTKTYRDDKAYPSSTLIYNDLLTIAKLGGSIKDRDI